MSFRYLSNEALDEARARLLGELSGRGAAVGSEDVASAEAAGRVTARAVMAKVNAPHYTACAMDGIAVCAADTFGATDTSPAVLAPSQYDVVDTGDPLPDGRDAVVMVEEVVRADDGSVTLAAPATPWQYVRQIGEDICAGEMIMPSGTIISPSAVGAMLAAGVTSVSVKRRPVVGFIPTGDEIAPPSDSPEPGRVMEFNSAMFVSMLRGWGADTKVYDIVRDDLQKIVTSLRTALDECDIVLLGAGSSAGRDDLSAEAIGSVGDVLIHGIAIRPGKPAVLGAAGSKAVIGVPGYPVSGAIILDQIVRPVIEQLLGVCGASATQADAVLAHSVVSGLKYREFVRVRLGVVGGRLIASPLARGAGVVSSMMKADGMMEIPRETEGLEAGARVRVSLLRPLSEIERTLIAIGSHDPMLDEIADMIRRANRDMFMSSTHVGSMGGVMAVKRGETHIAGIHLLDVEDGSYNISHIRRYIPEGGVRLVECLGRTQGIMIARGDPKGVGGLAGLSKPGVRYVNRQKGSGTRILFDHLLSREGISPDSISGYGREEMTHNSVAVQIKGGSADAGMGIFSAAKLYGLDMIPICTETYDLLIPDAAWDLPAVRMLIDILRSDEFRARATELGGYAVGAPGTVRAKF